MTDKTALFNEFFISVKKMRTTQKIFERMRGFEYKKQMLELEAKVDKMITDLPKMVQAKQKEMF